jgi:hypothetical protein
VDRIRRAGVDSPQHPRFHPIPPSFQGDSQRYVDKLIRTTIPIRGAGGHILLHTVSAILSDRSPKCVCPDNWGVGGVEMGCVELQTLLSAPRLHRFLHLFLFSSVAIKSSPFTSTRSEPYSRPIAVVKLFELSHLFNGHKSGWDAILKAIPRR